MMANPSVRCESHATRLIASGSAMSWLMRRVRYCQPSPTSMRSRDIAASVDASLCLASRRLRSRGSIAAILPRLCPDVAARAAGRRGGSEPPTNGNDRRMAFSGEPPVRGGDALQRVGPLSLVSPQLHMRVEDGSSERRLAVVAHKASLAHS